MTESCRADAHIPASFHYRFRTLLITVAGFALILFIAANADAIVIDFSTNPSAAAGELGFSLLDVDGVDVHGFSFNPSTSMWEGAHLFRRNDADDHGLGVCGPNETPCQELTSNGDVNELDNAGRAELIRLTLPAGFFWTEVAISSIDDNDDDEIERGQAFATDNADPAQFLAGDLFWQFAGDGATELTHAVPSENQQAQYIFFRPFDWSGGVAYGYNTNNDFLVWQATIEPVPEPGTLCLLGAGLFGLGIAVRRRKS